MTSSAGDRDRLVAVENIYFVGWHRSTVWCGRSSMTDVACNWEVPSLSLRSVIDVSSVSICQSDISSSVVNQICSSIEPHYWTGLNFFVNLPGDSGSDLFPWFLF